MLFRFRCVTRVERSVDYCLVRQRDGAPVKSPKSPYMRRLSGEERGKKNSVVERGGWMSAGLPGDGTRIADGGNDENGRAHRLDVMPAAQFPVVGQFDCNRLRAALNAGFVNPCDHAIFGAWQRSVSRVPEIRSNSGSLSSTSRQGKFRSRKKQQRRSGRRRRATRAARLGPRSLLPLSDPRSGLFNAMG